MTKEKMLEEFASLVASDSSVLEELTTAVQAKRVKEAETRGKNLPEVILTKEEFSSIESYVKSGALKKDPIKIVESIEQGFESDSHRDVLVGFCDLFAVLRENMQPHLTEIKKNRKIQELNKLAEDIKSGKIPA